MGICHQHLTENIIYPSQYRGVENSYEHKDNHADMPVLPCVAADQSPVQGSDTQGQAVSDREYLNALVEASAASTDKQVKENVCRVIRYKIKRKIV